MEEKRSTNFVELCGICAEAPVLSHENHNERFFTFPLYVERLSGQADLPRIVVPQTLFQTLAICGGMPLRVTGQLRSFNNKSGEGRRLVISVFAQTIEPTDAPPCNHITLDGVLCKPPVLRRTPLGRSICDMILAVNRRYGRSDYLPCIAWGQVAQLVGAMDVGARIALDGRVQSRVYNKQLPDGTSEERTAYEVSIMQLLSCDGGMLDA